MPNLMLTNWCNYKCPYCFGVDQMAPQKPAQAMSDETFLDILEWLKRSNYNRTIQLMGGEPTLHPKFEWIVETLLERDFPITVFSNLATDVAPIYAEKMGLLPISWVVNINPPNKWNETQKKNIEAALSHLKEKASITFNIMPDEDDNYWALELIKKFDLSHSIKIGFVLPTLTESNYALKDNEYSIVAAKVVDLAVEGAKMGVTLQYECGVPTCVFTPQQLGTLWRCGSQLRSGCCSRLDITPHGDVIYCLPLATSCSKKYHEFENYQQAKDWFEQSFAPYRRLGRTVECATCNLMNPLKCNAGCLAKNMIGANNVKLTK